MCRTGRRHRRSKSGHCCVRTMLSAGISGCRGMRGCAKRGQTSTRESVSRRVDVRQRAVNDSSRIDDRRPRASLVCVATVWASKRSASGCRTTEECAVVIGLGPVRVGRGAVVAYCASERRLCQAILSWGEDEIERLVAQRFRMSSLEMQCTCWKMHPRAPWLGQRRAYSDSLSSPTALFNPVSRNMRLYSRSCWACLGQLVHAFSEQCFTNCCTER